MFLIFICLNSIFKYCKLLNEMKESKGTSFQSLGNLWDCLTQFDGVLSKHNESLIKSANSKEQLKILFNI